MNTDSNQVLEKAGEYKIVEKYSGNFQLFYSEKTMTNGEQDGIAWKQISSCMSEELTKMTMIEHSISKVGNRIKTITKFNKLGDYVPYDL